MYILKFSFIVDSLYSYHNVLTEPSETFKWWFSDNSHQRRTDFSLGVLSSNFGHVYACTIFMNKVMLFSFVKLFDMYIVSDIFLLFLLKESNQNSGELNVHSEQGRKNLNSFQGHHEKDRTTIAPSGSYEILESQNGSLEEKCASKHCKEEDRMSCSQTIECVSTCWLMSYPITLTTHHSTCMCHSVCSSL